MSLAKYLQTISSIDSGKIYVENVRSILNVSKHSARVICEMAVQENVFKKQYGVICPNDDRIMAQYDTVEEIPDELSCHVCESLEKENHTFKIEDLRIVEFYQLNK